jgi:hypothetical protein
MNWPTWQQGAVTALVCGALALALRRPWRIDRSAESTRRAAAGSAFTELALIATLYAIWRVARALPLATTSGAVTRGRQVDHLERILRMPSELGLQHFVLDHQWLGRFLNVYYATVHVPATIMFMVWLYVRHRDAYPHWRNGLAISTAFCLVIRFVRVAPPRLSDLGYIDVATVFGLSVYGPMGTGVSDQLAAMPSIHVGWAALVSFGIVSCSTSRWRWWGLSHLVLTMLAVSATGNHWWLDGVVAIGLLVLSLWIDSAVRRWWRRRAGVSAGTPVSYESEGQPVVSRG